MLLARDGDRVVGCVALIPEGDGMWELAKMAVDESVRGRGPGGGCSWPRSTRHDDGERAVVLGSSVDLPAAVHLYESVGFRHVRPEEVGHMPYARASVFMRHDLGGTPGA